MYKNFNVKYMYVKYSYNYLYIQYVYIDLTKIVAAYITFI